MTTPLSSTLFESYVPVYDVVPEKWEDAREFLVEHLKKISNAVNIREIGWLLDEELISGKQLFPSSNLTGTSQQFRTVLRKVVDTGALVAGVNPVKAHGIVNDANFTLIDLWVSATNSATLTSLTMSDGPEVRIVGPNILIISPGAFDRSLAFIEYTQEL